jgi:hypothetical protein
MLNKKLSVGVLLVALGITGYFFYGRLAIDRPYKFTDRKAWSQACLQLPTNIEIAKNCPVNIDALPSAFGRDKHEGWQEFNAALQNFFRFVIKTDLIQAASWTNNTRPGLSFYDVSQKTFEPYVEKLVVQQTDEVIFHGDFHGDIRSFIYELNDLEKRGYLKPDSFELAQNNVYLVFLGDYVDKGYFGAEVIYTLLRLKLANPDRVIMVRGNHEDCHISNLHGFGDELVQKFGCSFQDCLSTYRLYDFMPVALYLGVGNDFLQCCHGGIEHGYQPLQLLEGSARYDIVGQLQREIAARDPKIDQHLPAEIGCKDGDACFNFTYKRLRRSFIPTVLACDNYSLGFLWFNFVKSGNAIASSSDFSANQELTQAVLDYQTFGSLKKVRGIIRAHQHDKCGSNEADPVNLMSELIASKGLYKLWRPIETEQERALSDGLVWTFNASPDGCYGYYGHYGFDTYAILKCAEKYEDWKLSVYNTQVLEQVS